MLTSRAVILAGGEGRKSVVGRTAAIRNKKELAAWSSVREGEVTCVKCKLEVIAVSCGQFNSILKVVDPCVLILCGDVIRRTSKDRNNEIGGGQ